MLNNDLHVDFWREKFSTEQSKEAKCHGVFFSGHSHYERERESCKKDGEVKKKQTILSKINPFV